MGKRDFEIRISPTEVRDSGKVRMGSLSPNFPAIRIAPAQTADSGKVRIFVWHEKAGFVNEGGKNGQVIDVSDAKKNFTINDVK